MGVFQRTATTLVNKAGKTLVDLVLNANSNNPIANSAVTAKFNEINNDLDDVKSDLTDIATGVSVSTNSGITKYGNRYFCNYRVSLATFTNGVATLDTITNETEKTKTNGLRLQAVAYNSSGSNFYPAIIVINNGSVTVSVSTSTSGQLYVTSIGYFN